MQSTGDSTIIGNAIYWQYLLLGMVHKHLLGGLMQKGGP